MGAAQPGVEPDGACAPQVNASIVGQLVYARLRGRIIQRTVLIAGATGNIGFAGALALARRGACVVLLGRHPERLRAKADLLLARAASAGAQVAREKVETLTVDFTDHLRAPRRRLRPGPLRGHRRSAGIFL